MSALPAPSGRKDATSVHRNGLAHRKATADNKAASTALPMERSKELRIAARSPLHDAQRAERDGKKDRDADQRRGRRLAVVEVLVRRLEDVIEQEVGGVRGSAA